MKEFLKMTKKIMIVILIIFALFTVGSKIYEYFLPLSHDGYTSPHIYLLNRETGNAIYEKDSYSKTYPASLIKMMTTIVALENIDDLSEITPIDVETYQDMVNQNASMAGFYGREKVTYRDLLYGTILSSGSEAANSLAIHVAGNVENFVQMMNAKAVEIGLENTHFTNPEGLHDKKQYTTAHDMAKLLDYALDNGDFKAIFTKETFQTTSTLDHPEGLLLKSTVLTFLNKDDQKGFEIIGGKSGTTYEAGQCWATLGLIENQEYISIVMGAPLADISQPDQAQIADTLKLYENIKTTK
ncbi:D-alanyl-D-alanine carboxypeptidase family protein [Amphibacillus sp. Q70]|uniref:D-alanyl-D-alanine carboxypeptidase family protein n=1 Tax=Amphibacillus sp. Q70 TaxID=3453416 RepID=UPI003F8447F3